MTIKLSTIVGSLGWVFAAEQSKLDKLKDHLTKRNITNVELIKGDYDNPKFPINSLEAVIIFIAYNEMDVEALEPESQRN